MVRPREVFAHFFSVLIRLDNLHKNQLTDKFHQLRIVVCSMRLALKVAHIVQAI